MRHLVGFLMLCLSAVPVRAQTLAQVLNEINTVLPSGSSLTAANVRTVLNYMAGSSAFTSGLTPTINTNLPSGSGLAAAALRTTLEAFTSNLGVGNQFNSYINGAFASADPSGISAAGLRQVLTTLATVMFNSVTPFALPTGDVLHYMAPTGNDACNGTTTTIGTSGNCAWRTPNHILNCGDVIIAVAGTYTSQFNNTITTDPSNCPSTSGGIDGTGGVYFVTILCAGPDLEACPINGSVLIGYGSGSSTGTHGNWAMEGFKATSCGVSACVSPNFPHAFETLGCGASNNQIVHHIAFINDVAYNSGDGYNTGSCNGGNTVPGNGNDYFAVIGSIAQNSVQDQVCLGAIDDVSPANSDTTQQVHVFFHGNFSYNNTTDCPIKDGESYLFDTFDAHGYTGTAILSNNIGIQSCHQNFEFFFQNYHNSSPEPIVNVYNNTFYAGEFCVDNLFAVGEIYMNVSNAGGLNIGNPYTISIYNNIARSIYANPGGGPSSNGNVYAFLNGGPPVPTAMTIGGTGKQNIFFGVATGCNASACDSTHSAAEFGGGPLGTNTYVDPVVTNGSDLLANRIGVPNCAGFASTTACMGYNVTTATLTSNTVIADLVPTAAGMSGKGYQLPRAACITASSPFFADFPNWLKAIVRLQLNPVSNTVMQMRDLVPVPCGM